MLFDNLLLLKILLNRHIIHISLCVISKNEFVHLNFKPDLFSIYAESFQQNPKIKQVRVETVISIELILQLIYQQML